ncbi:hypothetical protein FQN60_018153 [Etheostoma spectabile]|uniref:Uncharacterized protein n=1 Tax=Etheostoma spectabile TaxID=54343 RepID=A0A5J5DHD8_9PERO|nr:hypothetical protein FQN60_018153 [Etheostoma spectabile]
MDGVMVGLRHENAKPGDVMKIEDGLREDDGRIMDGSLGRYGGEGLLVDVGQFVHDHRCRGENPVCVQEGVEKVYGEEAQVGQPLQQPLHAGIADLGDLAGVERFAEANKGTLDQEKTWTVNTGLSTSCKSDLNNSRDQIQQLIRVDRQEGFTVRKTSRALLYESVSGYAPSVVNMSVFRLKAKMDRISTHLLRKMLLTSSWLMGGFLELAAILREPAPHETLHLRKYKQGSLDAVTWSVHIVHATHAKNPSKDSVNQTESRGETFTLQEDRRASAPAVGMGSGQSHRAWDDALGALDTAGLADTEEAELPQPLQSDAAACSFFYMDGFLSSSGHFGSRGALAGASFQQAWEPPKRYIRGGMGNGNPIMGACAPSQFIKDDQ